jgi:hypothetical protein
MQGLHLFVAGFLALSFVAQAQDPYKVSGYVTAVQPSGAFDLEGVHIHVTPTTDFRMRTGGAVSKVPASGPATFYVGETLDAIGRLDRTSHTLTAAQIVLVPPSPASVSGIAIIDLIPPASASAAQPTTDRLVRADGFLLHIAAKTKLNFADPLKSISDIATNQWIDYSGVQQLDGTVLLDYAGVGPNKVNHTEDNLRTKSDYDPSAVPDDSHQSGVSKTFTGVDARKIPPYHNEDMQARVDRIGQSLIPAYQRALPDTNPTKIHFRFQLIDATKSHDALTAPSGVILVPYQVVERMQNDDQLATVLADNIAEAIEKEGLRSLTAKTVKAIASDATTVGILLLGPAELVGGLVADHYASRAIDRTLQQSGRVSLCYLHDTGYDIAQAPLAWWLLAPRKPVSIDRIRMPPRAATLYVALGTTWHPIAEPAQLP